MRHSSQLALIGRMAVCVLLLMSQWPPARSAQAAISLPTGFQSELILGGLASPTTIAFAPDGRMFIGHKSGLVQVFQNGALLPTPFINLSNEVGNYWDRGLLGITIHPNFPQTPYVYLLYTYDPPGTTADGSGARVSRLLRVEADANNSNVASTAPGSRVVLLGTNSTLANIGDPNSTTNNNAPSCWNASSNTYIQDCLASDSPSHSIGTVMFGTDGSLYVGSGDGAHYNYVDKRALRALEVNSLNGKVLRIDPLTGVGYTNNPFYDGNPNSNASKVFSLGWRNPFRFTIHPLTGELYGGDVGWTAWEEVNTGRGKNFGWPCYEGGSGTSLQQPGYASNADTATRCNQLYQLGASAVQASVYAYDWATTGGASVQAGGFYVGEVYPVQYQNALFIEDYTRDWIKYLTFDGNGQATMHDFASDVSTAGGPVQLIVGPDTNLYYVVYNGATSEIRRIRYVAGGNTPPTAKILAAPTSGTVPLTVAFNSGASFDPDGQALTYNWDFGDGNASTQANPSHTYTTGGQFTVRLTVTDPGNLSDTDVRQITANNTAPVAQINSPASGTTYNAGAILNFSGSATDAEEGPLPGTQLAWEVLLHHNEHVHFDVFNFVGANGTFTIPDHGDNSWLELCLTASDSGGLTHTVCRALTPNTSPVSFATNPAGLSITYDGQLRTTPLTANSIINSQHDLGAPLTQSGLFFAGWADGVSTNSRSITIGASPASYTALYSATPANPNLLTNAGFETGTLTGWEDYGGIAVQTPATHTGLFGAAMASNGRIDQTFSTVSGQTYNVSAWLRINQQIVNPSWGGLRVQVVNSSNGQELGVSPFYTTANTPLNQWIAVNFSFTANSTSSRLNYQNFSGGGQFNASADDFSVVLAGGAPTATPTHTPIPPTATFTHTPLPPTATPTNPPPSDLIFADGFESGNFNAWSASATNNGNLTVNAAAALVDAQGMRANIIANTGMYVQSDHPAAEPRYRARFYFDPNSVPMTSGNAHNIFNAFATNLTTIVTYVEFRNNAGVYEIRAQINNDANTNLGTSWFAISDAPHAIEIDWRAASSLGANNGSLTLWIDGVQQASLTGIDNDTRRIERVRLGAASSIDTGTRGVEFFDAFESRRTTYIGLAGVTPTATPSHTPVPPTATPTSVPATPTPSNTLVAPTATFTNTPVPPTLTPSLTPIAPTATPTNTSVPPTATPVPPTPTPSPTPIAPTATPTNTLVPSGSVTITLPINQAADDVNEDGTTFSPNSAPMFIGTGQNTTASWLGLRFTNLTVPRGATITTARVEVAAATTSWISLNFTLQAENVGSCAAFTSTSKPSQRPLTTQSVVHASNVQWVLNTYYQLDAMNAVVQAVTNRADWNSGNSLCLTAKGAGSAWARKFIHSYDGNPALAPRLVIVYTVP